MNVIFTCGGTGGHINPAIAVADILKQRHPDCNILFIGAKGHMEEQLVPRAGYRLECLPGSGLSRKLNLAGIKKNLNAVKSVLSAVNQCKRIIRDFQPDVIIGTGGYASFPALYAGSRMGIPTCVHESNAVPGLTTKLAANKADRVLVCFEESKSHYKHQNKVQVVGMPVRREFWELTREEARKALNIGAGEVTREDGHDRRCVWMGLWLARLVGLFRHLRRGLWKHSCDRREHAELRRGEAKELARRVQRVH